MRRLRTWSTSNPPSTTRTQTTNLLLVHRGRLVIVPYKVLALEFSPSDRFFLPSETKVPEAEVQRKVDDRQQKRGIRRAEVQGDLAGRYCEGGPGPQWKKKKVLRWTRLLEPFARRGGRIETTTTAERREETAEKGRWSRSEARSVFPTQGTYFLFFLKFSLDSRPCIKKPHLSSQPPYNGYNYDYDDWRRQQEEERREREPYRDYDYDYEDWRRNRDEEERERERQRERTPQLQSPPASPPRSPSLHGLKVKNESSTPWCKRHVQLWVLNFSRPLTKRATTTPFPAIGNRWTPGRGGTSRTQWRAMRVRRRLTRTWRSTWKRSPSRGLRRRRRRRRSSRKESVALGVAVGVSVFAESEGSRGGLHRWRQKR